MPTYTESGSERFWFDAVSAVVLFMTAIGGAWLPKYLCNHGSHVSSAKSLAFHLGNMLSAGVMLSAGFCHLLADAHRYLLFMGRFPISNFLAATGYIITLLADQVVQHVTESQDAAASSAGAKTSGSGANGCATPLQRCSSSSAAATLHGKHLDAELTVLGSNSNAARSASEGVLSTVVHRDGAAAAAKLRSSGVSDPEAGLLSSGGGGDDGSRLPLLASTNSLCDRSSSGGGGVGVAGYPNHHYHRPPLSAFAPASGSSGGSSSGGGAAGGGGGHGPGGDCAATGVAVLLGGGGRKLSFATAVLLAMALCIHSILEGMALGAQQSMRSTEDIMVAIAAHKGLAAYALGASIVESGASSKKFWSVIGCFSFATPVGIFLGYSMSAAGSSKSGAALSALASGTFLYVAFMEVIPKELSDGRHRAAKMAALLLGYSLMSMLAIWA
ncbi:hypothetical protein Agub_g14631 [Astrephomene gubernaculifera]|uniref:Uncharacterized protein n=1 Tax=Astrephomene gubernaculifera TaxID=47775 RepID=A0AAD3E496_9CHLO|nr:hypothetical protein Agub_g14631 [Astrephomene gubernaculifera]